MLGLVDGRLFGTFGFRGIVDRDLTPEVALRVGWGLGSYLGVGKRVLIGHDARRSSYALQFALASGLLDCGCDVSFAGLLPTPTISFLVKNLGFDAGVVITASHNPPEWNGIKFYNSDGSAFSPVQDREVEKIIFEKKFRVVSFKEKGSSKALSGGLDRYVSAVVDWVNSDLIRKKRFTVVVDCGDGAASSLSPKLAEELNCNTIRFNCKGEGLFEVRPSEPTKENLGRLCELVRENNADVGFAHDGDADRTAVVDERGEHVPGDRILALVCHHVLRDKPGGKIVTPVNTGAVIDYVAKLVDATVYRTRIGEPNVVSKIKEVGAEVGGEENTGVVISDWSYAREGPLLIGVLLEILAREGRPLSEILADYPMYYGVRTKVALDRQVFHSHKMDIISKLGEMIPKNCSRVDKTDGYKLFFKEDWILIRPSGTEPIFRVFAESSKSREEAERLLRLGEDLINRAIKEVIE